MTQAEVTSESTSEQALQSRAGATALGAGLAAITMLFAAFVSAYVVRRGISSDWNPVSVVGTPLYVTALPLLVVTGALLRKSIPLALVCAVVFAALHGWTWLRLHHLGITLSTGPAAAFFIILTTAYQCCIIAGLVWLFTAARSKQNNRLEGASHYWHYLTLLWVSLLAVFYFWP